MRFIVQLYTKYSFAFAETDDLLKAFELFFSGVESGNYLRGYIADTTTSEIFAEFGYEE